VTAQDVENGSASLADFALAARDYFANYFQGITTQQQAYVRCAMRQEGSVWRSGLTYLVRLTPDSRVYIHARDMSFSGRRLAPAIYEAILRALGIDPGALTDPAAAPSVFTRAAAGNGGTFNVTDTPGASGYVTAYFTARFQHPAVLLAGFDLGEQHLVPIADEDLDYGDPPVAAEDVADRATLKAFVTAAGQHIIDFLESDDLAAASNARIVMRDPDGPWRHDPVYLAMMERASRQIVFHGGFPDWFEFRRGGIARDIATGELVVEQLVAAAESSPEGGFWLYHFDSPVDDTDSEDIPKLGYARVLTAHLPSPDGRTVPTDFIFNSGFYLTSDSEFVQRILDALDEGQRSILFGMTSPEDEDVVTGDAVNVRAMGAPTDTVHFAYRPFGLPDGPFTYAGAATNRKAVASFGWDTLDLPDDDYELVALYTEDDGYSVVYDSLEVSVDNAGDGGGGAAAPILPGGGRPLDPTLPALVGLMLAWLMFGRAALQTVSHHGLASLLATVNRPTALRAAAISAPSASSVPGSHAACIRLKSCRSSL